MKVVTVIHYPEYGGPHNQLLRLAPDLAAEGVETIAVLPPGQGADRLRDAHVAVKTLPLGRVRAVLNLRTQATMTARLPRDIVSLIRIFRRLRPDVVQLNSLINPHAAIAARLLGIPVVWQLLDTRSPANVRRLLMPQVRVLADVVMPVGCEVAKAHPGTERFGERMVIFYPPVDVDLFRPGLPATLREELDIPSAAPLVGVVGNINPQKGHEHFLTAAVLIRQQVPEARFVIAGHIYPNHSAYHRGLIDQAERSGMVNGRDLFFLGSRSDIPNVLNALDVFALASVPNSEGTPTAILEAMACGVPAVASDVGSVREVILDGVTGYIVTPENPGVLADRITMLLRDRKAAAGMGTAGRARVLDAFTLSQCVESHLRAYRLAMAHRSGRQWNVPSAPKGARRQLGDLISPSGLRISEDATFRDALSCPVCCGELAWSASEARCAACGHGYPVVDGVPLLLPRARTDSNLVGASAPLADDLSAHKLHQMAFYDGEDPEFEITRPHGTPAYYAWLLAEKSRRSIAALGDLRGKTVLTVCAGSGMDSEFLARAGATVIASDISLGAAQRTAERARRFGVTIFPIVADIEHLPFADGAVDIAYVHDGLHHLQDPRKGLAEMARVAAFGVSVTEPCDAAVTKLAIRARLADAVEEAGNRVERLRADEIAQCLEQNGFGAVHIDRYAMYYKHRPGPVMRTLSLPGVFPVARTGWRAANAALGRFGNKLAVQATRT